MSLQSELIADFRSMLAECGVEVEINGAKVAALVSEPQLGAQIDLTASPVQGQLVTVDGSAYRITTIRRRPSSPFTTLDLASPHE